MSAFVAMLAEEGICYASIRTYLLAVPHFQIASGRGDPGISQMAHLEYVLKGIRRGWLTGQLSLERKDNQLLQQFSRSYFWSGKADQLLRMLRCCGQLPVWLSLASFELEDLHLPVFIHLMRKSTSQSLISSWIILTLQAWYMYV